MGVGLNVGDKVGKGSGDLVANGIGDEDGVDGRIPTENAKGRRRLKR